MAREIFPIVPAASGPLWVLIPFLLIVLVVGGLLFWSFYGSRHVRFEVSEEGLRIRGDVYGRLIPRAHLETARARVIDLDVEKDYAPGMRTNGTGMPGYKAGWFALNNGTKALAFVTDRRHVLYVPTSEGYSVLMSAADPEGMLRALRNGP